MRDAKHISAMNTCTSASGTAGSPAHRMMTRSFEQHGAGGSCQSRPRSAARPLTCRMERYVSPSHLFLGLSTIMTVFGLIHLLAPEFALRLEGIDLNLNDEVVHVLYRSYG